MSKTPDIPVLGFKNQKDWTAWLAKSHLVSSGVWLKIAKKGSDTKSVSYDEAVEGALCFGWIDGQKKSYDGSAWLQKFTPRSAKSVWSKISRDKAEELIRKGKLNPAGLRAIESAKQDGRWEAAYDSPAAAKVPIDLEAELDKHQEAKAFFARLNGVNRYAILHRIQTAKKAETRAKRIRQFIEMLERHEKLYP